MTSIAASERTHLCALAQQLGPDAPTLCGDWTVKDLVVHLLLREGSPAAAGLLLPPLSGALARASEKRAAEDFATLVKRLRHGPPVLSPFAIPKLGSMLNLLEFYIHHEDVRRAQPEWSPRSLPAATQDGLWRAVKIAGRGLVMKSPVGVVIERTDTGSRARLKKGSRDVVLRGLPSELALYTYGRKEQARVDVDGKAEDVDALDGTPLGL